MSHPPRRATICISTYQRPVGLARLLEALGRLEVPEGWDFDVVVVDNDPDESARAVVAAQADLGGLSVRHVSEPTRGIPRVRNCALREAASTPFAAFIDDDEWPDPMWWRRLIEVQTETDADVVIGPSEPVFEATPPAWIVEGRFFERERFPNGTKIPWWLARTSGVLIRRAAFEHLGDRPFDERHPLAGGEDLRFFKALDDHGATIVWVDDAVVREFVPATRANAKWLLRRSFRTGNSRSLNSILEGATLVQRAKRVVRGLLDIGIGLVRCITARGKAQRIAAVSHSAIGVGLVVGTFGVRYNEYAVIHGT